MQCRPGRITATYVYDYICSNMSRVTWTGVGASVGDTACEPATWVSQTAVTCMLAAGVGRAHAVQVTASGRSGGIRGFSYDSPVITAVTACPSARNTACSFVFSPKVPLSGPAFLTVHGWNFGPAIPNTPTDSPEISIGDRLCASTSIVGMFSGFGGTLSCVLGNTGKTQLTNSPSVSVKVRDAVGTGLRLFSFDMTAMETSLLAGQTMGFTDGVGAEAKFALPQGIACDWSSGYAFVGDMNNNAIRSVHIGSGRVQTIAGTAGSDSYCCAGGSSASDARFARPTAVAGPLLIDGVRTLFVAEQTNYRVRGLRLSNATEPTVYRVVDVAGTGQRGMQYGGDDASKVTFMLITAMATHVGSPRSIFLADLMVIRELRVGTIDDSAGTSQGSVVIALAGGPNFGDGDALSGTDARFRTIVGLGMSPDGTRLYVAEDVGLDVGGRSIDSSGPVRTAMRLCAVLSRSFPSLLHRRTHA